MKIPADSIYSRSRSIPSIKFAPESKLTSYGGLVIFQNLFARLGLWDILAKCCAHLDSGRQYGHAIAMRCVLLHLILGFKRLRDTRFYQTDPMVLHTLGLKHMPSVATLSRLLSELDERSIGEMRAANRELITGRLCRQELRTITLDFDGSVLSTKRHAEGTAVGFNKHKKGARSCYPLFCTIAQSGQVFDVLHRSGNVHDSNGAIEFARHCVARVREKLPGVRLEARMDSAFFSDKMVGVLEALGVDYTLSVPFERFGALKEKIGARRRWHTVPGRGGRCDYFEEQWKPQCWERKGRFIFIRTEEKKQDKLPIQLDLFRPVDHDWQYKVIFTNKTTRAGHVAAFHEGRGYQEHIFGEMKQQARLGYIPCRRACANQAWLLCSMLAHNLGRELQMEAQPPARATNFKRTVLWVFEELDTLRRNIVQRAARLTRPQGRWTLTLPEIPALQSALTRFAA